MVHTFGRYQHICVRYKFHPLSIYIYVPPSRQTDKVFVHRKMSMLVYCFSGFKPRPCYLCDSTICLIISYKDLFRPNAMRCLLQQYFGFIRLGNNPGAYAVEAYPVIVQPMDIVIVFVVVSVVSLLTVLYPINNLKKKLNKA